MDGGKLLSLLFSKQDLKYKKFNEKIVNTKKEIIGVRTNELKSIARNILNDDYERFLREVKDDYHELILIEGFVISEVKDFDVMLNKLDKFMLKIDNWAVCDLVIGNAKTIKENLNETFSYVTKTLKSNNPWKVRCAFDILISYFVDDKYLDKIFNLVDSDRNDFYYVMMVKAWLISKCYVNYPKKTLRYLKQTKLDNVTYNMAINKIRDSLKVSNEEKKMLLKMKKTSKKA